MAAITSTLFNDLLDANSWDEWNNSWEALVLKTPSDYLVMPNIPSVFEKGVIDCYNQIFMQDEFNPSGLETATVDILEVNFNAKSDSNSNNSYGLISSETNKEVPESHNFHNDVPRPGFLKIRENNSDYYQCTWKNCCKRFTRRSTNSTAHWMRHINHESEYSCKTCSMGFNRKGDLRRHTNSSANCRT